MSKSESSFLSRLRRELPRLVGLGMLGEDQAHKILDFYALEERDATDARQASRKNTMQSRIPAIVIGIAVLLIGVGLIFFYAANWKWMPPTAKLIQVFALLLGIYGASWYLLFVRGYTTAGRGLLLLGMFVFGAAIGLIAQIYHISSQPSNGVLAWLIGVLALSIVMRETWGYFLAALLAYIWNSWVGGFPDGGAHGDPNYVFIVFPVLLAYLFYREQQPVGLLISVGLFFIWFYQVNFYGLDRLERISSAGVEAAGVAFLFTHVALGIAVLAAARLRENEFMRAPSAILSIVGWLLLVVPFAGLSWPIEFKFTAYALNSAALPFVIEQVVFTAIAGGMLYVLMRRGADVRWLGVVLVVALSAMFVPLGIQSVLLVFTYVGLLTLIGAMLYFAYAAPDSFGARKIDRFVAIAFTILTLLAKGFGLLFLAFDNDEFFIAYGVGFLIFATVIFLINQFVRDLLHKQFGADTLRYRSGLIDGACGITAFGMMYAMSFEIGAQNSIFTASTVVIVLLVLMIAIALGLYAVLWLRGAERLPLALSATIFLFALFTLVLANPQVSGVVYSVVFNFLIFLMTAVLIYYSTRISSIVLANFAIAGLVIQILTRYFDWFWDLLSGSVLFIVTGLLVLVGGFLLERNRRRLIAAIAVTHDEHHEHK